MILIINICKEKLHFYEFVKPIENIIKKSGFKFETKHYSRLPKNLNKYNKIIISGTSLKDNDFIEHLDKFEFIKNYKKPILGICGGMQVIGLLNDEKLTNKKQIGLIDNKYHLHNFALKGVGNEIKIGRQKGYLFHPEVRNKNLILDFAKL